MGMTELGGNRIPSIFKYIVPFTFKFKFLEEQFREAVEKGSNCVHINRIVIRRPPILA